MNVQKNKNSKNKEWKTHTKTHKPQTQVEI